MHNIYRGGTPDFWYSGFGGDLWAEYKWFLSAPVRTAVDTRLSELQKLWLNDAQQKGRNVCVIIGSPQGCVVLLDGAWNGKVSQGDFVMSEQDVANWIIGKVHAESTFASTNGNQPNLQDNDYFTSNYGDDN